MIHSRFTNNSIHTPFKWVKSESERLLIDLNDIPIAERAFEVDKVCLQTDDFSLWVLRDYDPITWECVKGKISPEDIEYQVNVLDTTTENIIIGNKLTHRAFFIDFTDESGLNYEAGRIGLVHNGTNVTLDKYYFSQPSFINNLTFTADINNNNVRLIITNNVGGLLKFKYRVKTISITT